MRRTTDASPVVFAEVGDQRLDAASLFGRLASQPLEPFPPARYGDNRVSARGKFSREHQADPGRRAGDHGPTFAQFPATFTELFNRSVENIVEIPPLYRLKPSYSLTCNRVHSISAGMFLGP